MSALGFEEFVAGLVASVFAKLFVSRPAKVERYDESLQQVDVRPLFRESYTDSDGNKVSEPPALVQNVPLVWPGSAGGYLSFGLDVGDVVALVYFDRSSDRWKSLGEEVDPVDVRRHHPSDAWAIPGLHAFNAPLSGVSRVNSVLSVRAGAQLLLGSPDASDAVARASLVEAELASLWTAVMGHTHTGGTLPGGSTGPAAYEGSAGSVGSSVVKVAP